MVLQIQATHRLVYSVQQLGDMQGRGAVLRRQRLCILSLRVLSQLPQLFQALVFWSGSQIRGSVNAPAAPPQPTRLEQPCVLAAEHPGPVTHLPRLLRSHLHSNAASFLPLRHCFRS